MVLRKSRKCEKTLREAVTQKHKLNGNAVEVFLNHATQWGLLCRNTSGYKKLWVCNVLNIHPTILQATKSCGCVMFWIFIQQVIPPLQQLSSSFSTMR